MKNKSKKHHAVETTPKPNRKRVKAGHLSQPPEITNRHDVPHFKIRKRPDVFEVVSSNPNHACRGVLYTTLCDKVCQ